MKMNIYSIYDTAAAVYMRPFFCQADGQAMRMFSDISTDAEHDVGKHPEDYSLVRLGRWNDATADMDCEPVRTLATGLEMVAAARNVNTDNLELFDKTAGNGEELRND